MMERKTQLAKVFLIALALAGVVLAAGYSQKGRDEGLGEAAYSLGMECL